jgi:translation initiation factor IF-1
MDQPITTIATIIEPFSNVFRASLPNGKIVLTHFGKNLDYLRDNIFTGTQVIVEMTTYDFDIARIISIKE